MKNITYKSLVESGSGKLHSKSNIHLRHNSRTGQSWSVTRDENYQFTRTDKQRDMRSSFGERTRTVSAWLRANPAGPDCSPARLEIQKLFDSQTRYSKIDGFLMANIHLISDDK